MSGANHTNRRRSTDSCGERDNCAFAEEAADSAVKKVFAILGVDIAKPESVERFREDLRFGGKMRKAADHGILVMIAAIVSALMYAVYLGVVARIKGDL